MFEKGDLAYHIKNLYQKAAEVIPRDKKCVLILEAAEILITVGNYEDAEELVRQITESESFEKLDYVLKYRTIDTLRRIKFKQGKFDEAIELLEKARKIAEDNGDEDKICRTLVKMGNIYVIKGEYEKAKEFYSKALDVGEQSVSSRCLASAYNNLAIYEITAKYDLDKAMVHLQKALSLYESVKPNSRITGEILTNLANLFRQKGLYDKAQDYYQRAHSIASRLHRYELLAHIYHGKAELYRELNEYEVSLVFAEKALELYKTVNGREGRMWVAETYQLIANLYNAQAESFNVVSRYFKEAITILENLSLWDKVVKVYEDLVFAAEKRGLLSEAKEALLSAIAVAEDHGMPDIVEKLKRRVSYYIS